MAIYQQWTLVIILLTINPFAHPHPSSSNGGIAEDPAIDQQLARKIRENPYFTYVQGKAREVVQKGFNAGDGYGEVWIRDYNTFIALACEVHPHESIKENLRVFFRLQGQDGNIVDGFIPKDKAAAGYDYIYTKEEPRYAGHKNTVETDQESSLIQAVYQYVKKTGDEAFLQDRVGQFTVAERMEKALQFLTQERYSKEYGLLWGATTADWGDVQPEHAWGVYLTDSTHYAIDIYDNAMFLIAIDNFLALFPGKAERWQTIREQTASNCRKHLWDEKQQKFLPHLYLKDSPFPKDFNEHQIYYHGGTAVAIEAGLLSRDEVRTSLEKMIDNVQAAGAASIGLTLYPPYPEGFFKNESMHPYGYQNGGDWTWFGARMIQQLIHHGMVAEAYEQIQPMVKRVKENKGFYEWYTPRNEPKGSGTFRGSAGVLHKAITMFYQWAEENQ